MNIGPSGGRKSRPVDPLFKSPPRHQILRRDLQRCVQSLNSERMEVHFTPNTQARIQQLAASEGKDAEQVVEETVTRVMERRAQFLEGVERGIAPPTGASSRRMTRCGAGGRNGNAPDAYPLDATRIQRLQDHLPPHRAGA